jgi:hypothetical protein
MNAITIEKLGKINSALLALQDDLRAIEWSPECLADDGIGKHFVILQNHLDNAQGRCATLAQHIPVVSRAAAYRRAHLND